MKHLPNPSKLLNSSLIIPKYRPKAKKIFRQYSDPLGAIIANEYVRKKDFFSKLAQLYDLRYISSIPTNISADIALAQQVPQELLVTNSIYLYKQGKHVVVCTSDPFVDTKIINKVLLYTSQKKFEIAISCPAEIRKAIANTFYYDLNITSEDIVSVLYPTQSTKTYSNLIVPRLFPIATLLFYLALLIVFPSQVLFWSFVVLNLTYFLINPYKFYAFFRSFSPRKSIYIKNSEIKKIKPNDLPVYTVLVPLRDEAAIAQQIVKNITNLDYPKNRLDIKFITEIDDIPTNEALAKLGVGMASPDASPNSLCLELVKVPQGGVKTKPRSTDYALGLSRGQLITIYDAEDNPEPDQLKKTFVGFNKTKIDSVCIQARLNFYNSHQNILTRLFSLEYGFWFNHFLPGLEEIGSPIPLGGTSNHFVKSTLKKLGSWDAFNVTEDADLGLRIFRHGLTTSVINSTTLEEANSKLLNWIRQRTRWQKGFLVTFLVHTSRPGSLMKDLGVAKFLQSLLNFGGNFFLPLFNPVLWLFFIATILQPVINIEFPPTPVPLELVAIANLIVGNGTYIAIHLTAAYKDKRNDLAPYALLLPFYWMLISVATVRAAGQFFRNPFYWEKTRHGLIKI